MVLNCFAMWLPIGWGGRRWELLMESAEDAIRAWLPHKESSLPHLAINLRHTLGMHILIALPALIISYIGVNMVLPLNCANLKELGFQGDIHVSIHWLPPACMDKKSMFLLCLSYMRCWLHMKCRHNDTGYPWVWRAIFRTQHSNMGLC